LIKPIGSIINTGQIGLKGCFKEWVAGWAYFASFNMYVCHVQKFTSEINEEGEGLRKKRKIGFLFFVILFT
jgi:hypothetical protein